MRKVLIALSLVGLAGCVNPEVEQPYINGPTYYKTPECFNYQAFPKTYKRYNPQTGFYDTYVTYENVWRQTCNYNPGNYSLNTVYMYGTSY